MRQHSAAACLGLSLLACGQAEAGVDGRVPSRFSLYGQKFRLTYSTAGVSGSPVLVYQDAHRTARLGADRLQIAQTGMGTEVTFVTQTDAGPAAITALMPLVTLGAGGTARFRTIAVNTVLQPVAGGGTHETVALAGTASNVPLP